MKIIITGASGMVGHAVLIECLEAAIVKEILLINRRPIELHHPKIKELLVADFEQIPSHAQNLAGYDACFHCMGVSAMGLSEEAYTKMTFGYSKILFDTLYKSTPGMIVTYISGVGTDSSEKGNSMWARVKGKTENYLLHLGFKDAYAFRPGIILPEKGVKSKTGWYNTLYVLFRPIFPLFKRMKNTIGSSNLGKAMLLLLKSPNEKKVFEPYQIKQLANK
ncbi:NAD-dependent epimerase/dehydratase family protein [Cyclobacterium amurskyense]|uniref:NAD-dependent epimerase/dehydratase family protein n=1 Tax=Cyclobacterium amurskyense TaxID=320787 RepID=UPI0030D7E571|tara:strand:+ start:17277 stop:17939 length:663 start_codon:yes stop_codon:yes gene_type:complete